MPNTFIDTWFNTALWSKLYEIIDSVLQYFTWYVVFPQGQCLTWLNGQGGHWSPWWQMTSQTWYPQANFFPHLSSHCHWGSEQWHSFCCFLHKHNWTLFLLQGSQAPSWHGMGQKCWPHANGLLQGFPQDQSLSKHLLVAGAVWPQKHFDLTTFGHGGHGPIFQIWEKYYFWY